MSGSGGGGEKEYSGDGPLRIFLFPLPSPGHMIPVIDMAKLFAVRGASTAVITTAGNEPHVRPFIDSFNRRGVASPIELIYLPLPASAAATLPRGLENMTLAAPHEFTPIILAFFALRDALAGLLRDRRPDCLVSDAMLLWTSDVAAELGVPRVVFDGPGLFALSVHRHLELHTQHHYDDPFVLDQLPHRVEMARAELSNIFTIPDFQAEVRAAEEKSFGVVVNSFAELEPKYDELFKKQRNRRAWVIGPVSFCNRGTPEVVARGQRPSSPEVVGQWLSWLDGKPKGSVVYVCFGSLCELPGEQLREIALGLESSGCYFFWVVRNAGAGVSAVDEIPAGYEGRVGAKGVVVKGWAPQALVLGHAAMGGFVTHCGWNSVLEAVAAELPMATWPMEYEQFVNEKLVTQVLRIGLRMRAQSSSTDGIVTKERVAEVVGELMGGEAAPAMREKVKELAAKAAAAVEDGGSSYNDLGCLFNDLLRRRVADVAET